jgi:ribosome-associated protein
VKTEKPKPLEATIPTPIELTHRAARIAQEKKADDLVILELEKKVSYCDYFLICSGRNRRQVRAIAESISVTFKQELGIGPRAVEGMESGRWVLLDFGDLVVHVFDEPLRGFYDLEGLWKDAPRLAVPTLSRDESQAASAV